MRNIVISFSGGRTSAFMAKYLFERYPNDNKIVVFANTGKERPETLDFVNQCDKSFNLGVVWLEAVVNPERGQGTGFKIVTYETADRTGQSFEDVIKKYGLPNQSYPHCTRDLKLAPINKYVKSLNLGVYETAIGIRHDERHRINRSKADVNNYIYPLADEIKVDSKFIRDWWAAQPFDLQLKDYQGNCDMCWKKSKRKLLTLIVEDPKKLDWWVDMERKYGKGKYTFFRHNNSGLDLIEMAKGNFRKAVDLHELNNYQPTLFDNNMDLEYDCLCKST